jgi:O-succinylbenzoic acid--CoA ligase
LTSVQCLLSEAARLWPEAPALIDAGMPHPLSFRALNLRVQALCDRLAWPGLDQAIDPHAAQNRLVLVECHTRVTDLVLILALIRAGWICVPTSFRHTDQQLQTLVRTLRPALLVSERPLAVGCRLCHPVALEQGPALGRAANEHTFDAARPVTGLFTSGSSGTPKLALHSYSAHRASAAASRQRLPLQPGDRNLMSLPLFHIGGLAPVFRNLLAGSTMVFGGRADDASFLHQQQISHLSFVSTQLRALIAQKPQGLRIPYALVGGGPIEPALLESAQRAGIDCWESYGLTEMSSQVATGSPAGRWQVLPGNELRLDADGAIQVRGATRFLGYWRDGRLDRSCFLPGGWFATQDLGAWHDEHLSIHGRLDNLFISGGENIQPEEIERELLRHPAVERVLVCSVADVKFGRRPIALVELHSGSHVSSRELGLWLAANLPRFKLPQQWWQYPRRTDFTGSGLKINRTAVQAWVDQQAHRLTPLV